MKRKKLYWMLAIIGLFSIVIWVYICKPMSMNDIYNEPNFKGIVSEVNEKSILVLVNEDEEVFNNSHKISVSLDVKLKDSMTHFNEGDKVSVYYDGNIAETYPSQVNTVYAILLNGKNEVINENETDLIPMVMIYGKLYYDTGKESDIKGRCGVMDGCITSSIKQSQIPTEDNQSNFGEGYDYQFVDENSIDIYINDKWFRFEIGQ